MLLEGYKKIIDGTFIYKENEVAISVQTGSFNGRSYVKNNHLYIIGELILSSNITAYSDLVFFFTGINCKPCQFYIKKDDNTSDSYSLYSGGGVNIYVYANNNISAGTYWINIVIPLA